VELSKLKELLMDFADDERRSWLFFGKDPEHYILPDEFCLDIARATQQNIPPIPEPLCGMLTRIVEVLRKAIATLEEPPIIESHTPSGSFFLDHRGDVIPDIKEVRSERLNAMYRSHEWIESISIAKRAVELLQEY
jgi:hypothetical protein